MAKRRNKQRGPATAGPSQATKGANGPKRTAGSTATSQRQRPGAKQPGATPLPPTETKVAATEAAELLEAAEPSAVAEAAVAEKRTAREPSPTAKPARLPTAQSSTEAKGARSPKAAKAPKAARPAKPGATPKPSSPLPVSPYGFALEMSSLKLAIARFAIFAVLAVDAVLQISHASRYGAGGFNVPHVPGLPGPGREAYLLVQCAIVGLSLLVAVGAGGRLIPAALSLAYGWCYFGSQLDSFQHHYLVWLVITLWCFVPLPQPGGSPAARAGRTVRSSALRLILLQLGIMYLWAGISKLDPKWLDGTAMAMQIHGLMRDIIDATLGIKIVSRLVIVAELALAVTVWRARAWRWALPLGIGLHLQIAISGLDIGVFAYLMMAIYLLIVPEALMQPVLRFARERLARPWAAFVRVFDEGHRPTAAVLAAAGVGLLVVVRPPLRNPICLVLVAVPMILTVRWQLVSARRFTTRAALAAALAMAVMVVVDRAGAVALDYYRYWGGTARRLGEPAEAEVAYRGLIDVQPRLELAHYQLGRLLIRRGALEDGLSHLRLAEQLEPLRTRALDEQSRALDAAGRHDEAKLAAQRAKARRDAATAAGRPAESDGKAPGPRGAGGPGGAGRRPGEPGEPGVPDLDRPRPGSAPAGSNAEIDEETTL